MTEQWFVFRNKHGTIFFSTFRVVGPDIPSPGRIYSADSPIAKLLDAEPKITVLVVCNDEQNNLLSALDALENVSGTSDGELIGTVAKLIEAARKIP